MYKEIDINGHIFYGFIYDNCVIIINKDKRFFIKIKLAKEQKDKFVEEIIIDSDIKKIIDILIKDDTDKYVDNIIVYDNILSKDIVNSIKPTAGSFFINEYPFYRFGDSILGYKTTHNSKIKSKILREGYNNDNNFIGIFTYPDDTTYDSDDEKSTSYLYIKDNNDIHIIYHLKNSNLKSQKIIKGKVLKIKVPNAFNIFDENNGLFYIDKLNSISGNFEQITKFIKGSKDKSKESPKEKTKESPKEKTKESPKLKAKEKPEKKCPEGKILNPLTGRCIKIKNFKQTDDNVIQIMKKIKTFPELKGKNKGQLEKIANDMLKDTYKWNIDDLVYEDIHDYIMMDKPKEKAKESPKEKAKESPKEKPEKKCPEGKILNPLSGRCIKIKNFKQTDDNVIQIMKKIKTFPELKGKNKGQLEKIANDMLKDTYKWNIDDLVYEDIHDYITIDKPKEKPEKKCPEGKILNPLTGRCIKDKNFKK